jgi:VWFA-related protein
VELAVYNPIASLRGGLVRRGPQLVVFAVALLTSTAPVGSSQSPSQSADPPRFRVGVDAVRIDAVVTDKDGNLVTDLTAADFELRQDGEVQPITVARYVAIDAPQSRPAGLASTSLPGAMTAPVVSSGRLTRSKVQRTMVLVVDDLGIAWENMEATRKALRRFVDEEVQEGDLVALVRTGSSWGALQQLTTDRRILYAAIDQVRWTAHSRRGVGSFRALNAWLPTSGPGLGNIGFTNPDPEDFGKLDDLRESMSTSGTMSTLTNTVLGIKDQPGRKSVVLISEGFVIVERSERPNFHPDSRVRRALDRLLDQAMRTGTVIYALDPRGLQSAGLTAEDNAKSLGVSATSESGLSRKRFLLETQDTLAYLAEETGGMAVVNTNDLSRGLKRIGDDQRGYYVLGYSPPANTFAAPGKTPRQHSISVRIRRPGLNVRTRKGFLGVSDVDRVAGPLTPEQELREAALSPFGASDIPVRATLLPGLDTSGQASVRALLHIDARALRFTPGPDGRPVATADVASVVFDESGQPSVGRTARFTFARGQESTDDSLEAGVIYSMMVPVKRPGGVQVRFAVRDAGSGALGSAGEFVEIPELKKGALALSGVVLGEESQSALTPDDDTAAVAQVSSPALRVFRPGARLVYTYEIYNAVSPVDTRVTVWRDGRPHFSAPPSTLTASVKGRPMTAAGGIKLGEKMPPGDYVFQVSAITNPDGRGKAKTATRWTSFEVRANQ